MQAHASPFLGHEEEKNAWPMPSKSQVKGKDYWSLTGLTAHQVSNMIQVSVKIFIHETGYIAGKSCQAFLRRSHK